MLIREIQHYPERNTKNAIICLSYEELRDISNALHKASKENPALNETRAKMWFLFDIMSNGTFDRTTLTHTMAIMDNRAEYKGDEEWLE